MAESHNPLILLSRGSELNRRPADYESAALPAELPRLDIWDLVPEAGFPFPRCRAPRTSAFYALLRSAINSEGRNQPPNDLWGAVQIRQSNQSQKKLGFQPNFFCDVPEAGFEPA